MQEQSNRTKFDATIVGGGPAGLSAALMLLRARRRILLCDTADYIHEGHVHILQHKDISSYVSIFRIHGPFLFGATDKIDEIVSRVSQLPPIIILRLRNMTAIDATGLQALEKLADVVHSAGRELILCVSLIRLYLASNRSFSASPARSRNTFSSGYGRLR